MIDKIIKEPPYNNLQQYSQIRLCLWNKELKKSEYDPLDEERIRNPMPYSINGDYCFCEIHDKETVFKNSGYERPLEKNYNDLTKLFSDILFFIY